LLYQDKQGFKNVKQRCYAVQSVTTLINTWYAEAAQ